MLEYCTFSSVLPKIIYHTLSFSRNSKDVSKKENRTSQDVRKVWLLPFYNLINDSMMAAGTRRSMGEANGDNNAVTVDKSNCL